MGAAQLHRRHDRRVRPAVMGRRRRHDALHAGDLRGHHAHMRRGDHRVFPAWHVAADAVHGDIAVPENDAGHGFDFEVLEAGFLMFGEVADLGLGEFDIVEIAFANLAERRLYFRFGKSELLRRPVVEPFGIFAQCGVAARLDLPQNSFDELARFSIVPGGFRRVPARLQVPRHFRTSLPASY